MSKYEKYNDDKYDQSFINLVKDLKDLDEKPKPRRWLNILIVLVILGLSIAAAFIWASYRAGVIP